jgi:hypothetical protein
MLWSRLPSKPSLLWRLFAMKCSERLLHMLRQNYSVRHLSCSDSYIPLGTCDEYKLLEKMNSITTAEYADMTSQMQSLSAESLGLQAKCAPVISHIPHSLTHSLLSLPFVQDRMTGVNIRDAGRALTAQMQSCARTWTRSMRWRPAWRGCVPRWNSFVFDF